MKGSVQDILFICIFLLVTSFFVVSSYFVLNALSGTAIDAENAITNTRNAFVTFDDMYMFFLLFLSIGAIAAASVVRSHPIFLTLDLFLIALMVYIGSALTEAYYQFASNAQIAASATMFPKILFIMTHLTEYVAIVGILIAIVYYGKGRMDGYNGGPTYP